MREKPKPPIPPAPPVMPPKMAAAAMLDGKVLKDNIGRVCFWDKKTNGFIKKTDDGYVMPLNRFDDLWEALA